jgi:uncharacterized protein involved in type VI secretion and phage assembly
MNALLDQYRTQVPMFQTAILSANNDPDQLGCVKVEYPLYKGQSSSRQSQWARICQPYASKDQGMWVLPEVGDEVLVFFPNGNPADPVIMGTLYS